MDTPILDVKTMGIATLIAKALLRWLIDVTIFLLLVLAFLIWRSNHTDRDAQREEVWSLMRDEIRLGSARGEEERRAWLMERLMDLESEGRGSMERRYGACEVQKREEEEWMRAGREMAMIAEEGLRLKRLEGEEEVPRGGWCECDPENVLIAMAY